MTVFKKRTVFLLFILMLIASALPNLTNAASPFKDVKADHWAYSSIEWAVKKGIVNGYSNGSYAPQRTLTESEFIAMLIRYDCSDKRIDRSSSANYRYVKSKNIPLKGYLNAALRDQPITRGQVARIVAAFEGVDLSEPHAVQYMYMKNLSSGMTGKKDYQDYGADRSLNRGEAAVFLNRLSKRGKCPMVGLNDLPSGRDDDLYKLPLNFLGDGTVTFPPPEDMVKPPAASQPIDSRLADIDIQKKMLIANGIDSTFITLKLKDCYGNPISYDESLSFQVSSEAGAAFKEGDYGEWFDSKGNEKVITSAYSQTDGPDLTVEVVAPKLSAMKQDTLSFQTSGRDQSSVNMACYQNPVTVDLDYVPQAELRVETGSQILSADGVTTTRLTATIVRPGGETITDYNGRARFRSAQGALLSTQEASFMNGIASTTLTSLSASSPVTDELFAEIIQADSRYTADVSFVLDKTHSTEVVYDSGLSIDSGCPRDDLEVAFIIDSSGSMKRNDAERLRVSKSKEFISALNAPQNIAAHFNGSGYLLSGLAPVSSVRSTFYNVFQSGGTNISKGLETAFGQFSGSDTSSKIAILLTDGKSNERTALEMIDKANRQNIKIYTIGLGDKKQLNEALLQKMASETGGQYFHVEKNIAIGTAYQSILSEVSCGVPYPACPQSIQVFSSPVLESTRTDFYMNTFITENCGTITRVVLRFHSNSNDGDIDYELIPRGQNYHALRKSINEISNLSLYKEGTFLAYDAAGTLVGQIRVPMRNK